MQVPLRKRIKIELEDVLGKRSKLLADEKIPAGEGRRNFSTTDLPEGVYFLRVYLNGSYFTEKLVIE